MQELKMQNGLLLQLVKGLQNQINSKNRENHILFQQYEQLAADNSTMRAQIDSLKSKQRDFTIDSSGNSPRQQQHVHLKQRITALEQHIKELLVQLDQKGGSIILLESQLHQLQSKQIVYQKQQEAETNGGNGRKNQIRAEVGVSVFNQSNNNRGNQLYNELARKIEHLEGDTRQKDVIIESISRENNQLKQKIVTYPRASQKDTKMQEELTENLNQLKTILASKEQSILQLGQFLSAMAAKSEQAAQKQQQLQNNLKQALSRMLTMEEDIDSLKKQLAQVNQEKQRKVNEQSNVQILAEKDQTISECFQRINQLTEKIQQFQSLFQQQQNQKMSAEIDDNLKQLTKQQQVTLIQRTLQEKQRVISECFQRINQLTEKIQQFEVSYKRNLQQQIQEKINAKDQIIAQLSQQLNEQLKSIADLNQKIKQLQITKAIQNSREKGQKSIKSHGEISNDLQHIISGNQESLVDMGAYIQQNNLRLAKSQQNQASLSLKTEQLQEKLKNNVKIQQNDKNRHSDEINEKIKELEENLKSKQHIIAEFKEQMNEQSLKVASFQDRKNQVLDQQIERYESIVSSLKEKEKILENIVRQKQEQIILLKVTLEEKELKIQQFQTQNYNLVAKSPSQNSAALMKMQQFQQILAKQGTLILHLTQKIQDLQQRQMELQKQLQQVQAKNKPTSGQPLKENEKPDKIDQNANVCYEQQQLQHFQAHIAELEAIISSKSDTIAQLSQFMNEQATTIAQVQAKLQNYQAQSNQSQKIANLQSIINMKEQSVQDLKEYLEQNSIKTIELQATIAQLESKLIQAYQTHQNTNQNSHQQQKELQKRLQEFAKTMADFEMATHQKKQLLEALLSEIDQKRLQLQNFKSEYLIIQSSTQQLKLQRQQHQNVCQTLRKQVLQLENNINALNLSILDLSKEKSETQKSLKSLFEQINAIQSQLNQNQARQQKQGNPLREHQQWQILFSEKQQEVNTLGEILEKLQDQIRSKNQVIQYLQERGNLSPSNQEGAEQPVVAKSSNQYQQSLVALQSQNQNLRAQHRQLIQRLDMLQQGNNLPEKYDFIALESQLGLQSKIIAEPNCQQLVDLRQNGEKKQPALVQENPNEQEQHIVEQEKPLNITQIISQLLIYSEGDCNLSGVKHLLHSLNRQYLAQFQAFQAENNSLKQEINNVLGLKEDFSKEKKQMHSQIKQLNQQIEEKNQLIQSLHEMNGQKEKSFNDKIQQIRNSFQVTGNPFNLNFPYKQESEAEQIAQQADTIEQLQGLKSENKELNQLVKELRDELHILLAENKLKSQQIQSLKSNKSPTMEKEFVDLLRDSNSNIHQDGGDSRQQFEKFTLEKDHLSAKCATLGVMLEQASNENKQLKQAIETLKIQLRQQETSKVSPSSGKILKQLQQKKQEEKIDSEISQQKNQIIMEQLLEKNQIIAELQETVLKLQKGYNAEIMQLRKSNAQLNAQLLALTKKIFMLDPNAVDIADFIKQSCRQAMSQTQYYKSRHNIRYNSHYSRIEQPHNSSYLTEHQSRTRRYEPFFNHKELTLGEKIIGRTCRGDPLNYTMNNDFRLNFSAWEIQGSRPL